MIEYKPDKRCQTTRLHVISGYCSHRAKETEIKETKQ